MAHGGIRVGQTGRPRKGEAPPPKPEDEARREAKKEGLSPLEYMLQVMNDDGADDARRDRMAVAAAPYVHGKAPDAPAGKKEQRQKAAEEKASSGSKFAPPAPPRVVVNNG
jgi:hypothetical protein